MPEGPSIVILKEAVKPFQGKRIIAAAGNMKVTDPKKLKGKTVHFKSWGKHFLICLDDLTIRIHLLMFGSYSINERKDREPRLRLEFKNGELSFYNCAAKLIEGDINDTYDWSADVMNEAWSAAKAKKKLKADPDRLVCDVLLDQEIFSGVGNIIKNEVLFRIRVHPATKVMALPPKKLNELVKEAVNYSYDFLKWKKEFTLKQHWLINTKSTCPECKGPVTKDYMGKTNRRTFYCPHCQKLYK